MSSDKKVCGSRKKGSRRIDGSHQFWVSTCWWPQGDKNKRSRGVVYLQNGELMDLLKAGAPTSDERKQGKLGKYVIKTPSGKITNLLSDMMFNDFQYYQKIWEAWYKLWLDNGFNLPQEADDACENASSDIESKAVYQTNIEALQQELLQAQQQFMKAIAEINSNIARQK